MMDPRTREIIDSMWHPGRDGSIPAPIDPPLRSGDDGGMEARIAKLESSMSALEKDVAVIKSNYATKEDVAKLDARIADAKTSIIQWTVGVVLLAQLLPAVPAMLKALHWLS